MNGDIDPTQLHGERMPLHALAQMHLGESAVANVATPPAPSQPQVGEYGWHTARETLDIYLKKFGAPADIPNLSVDEVTARRMMRSGYVGVVQLQLGDAVPHPALFARAEECLQGRGAVAVLDDESLVELRFSVASSHDDKWATYHFGYALGYLAGAVPRVWVHRPEAISGAKRSERETRED